MRSRLPRALALAAIAVVAAAGPALAHVTVHPVSAPDDGYVAAAFRIPNEDAAAATVRVEVTFPARPAIANASTQPVPGWKATVTRTGDRVASITWIGGRIGPGEYQEFPVSMGQLPDDTEAVTFKALQTYDNGDVVRWIESKTDGGPEPEHPAPVLELTAATASTGDAGHDRQPMAAYGIAVAALALSVVAFVRSARRPAR